MAVSSPTRSSNLPDTNPARRAPATPLHSVSLRSALIGWAAAALWAIVAAVAILDPGHRRSDGLTELMAAAAVTGIGAVASIAWDIARAIRLRWGGAEERYWAGYADCARTILGERRPPAVAARPGHRPRPSSR